MEEKRANAIVRVLLLLVSMTVHVFIALVFALLFAWGGGIIWFWDSLCGDEALGGCLAVGMGFSLLIAVLEMAVFLMVWSTKRGGLLLIRRARVTAKHSLRIGIGSAFLSGHF